MIPSSISATHVESAAAEIDREGWPAARSSVHYDLVLDGKRYPPKYVISLAARYATGEELSPQDFDAGEATAFLTRLGFTIEDQRGLVLPIPPSASDVVFAFLAEAIQFVASLDNYRWGCTYYPDRSLRLNVGWTESITINEDGLRVIVDGAVLGRKQLNDSATVTAPRGKKGFYPSVPGSALIDLSVQRSGVLETALADIRDAHQSAMRISSRRPASDGVQSGHSQWAVDRLGQAVGLNLPTPGYLLERTSRPKTPSRGLELMEGAIKRVAGSRHERSREARWLCVEHHGCRCAVCDFRFEDAFGAIGKDFIHVHHIEPLAARKGSYAVDPIHDLVPVCPNCHAMLHRVTPPYEIEALRDLRAKQMDCEHNSADPDCDEHQE